MTNAAAFSACRVAALTTCVSDNLRLMFSASISIQAEESTSHSDLTEGGSVVTGAKDKAMIGVNRVLHLHEGFL